VPMGALKKNNWFLRDHLRPEHIEALAKMYEHTRYWALDILRFYMSSPVYLPFRLLLRYFIWFVDRHVKKYMGKLEEMVKK
ncbi:MAG: radical SAM protein, partial [Desulfurococcaceae archaeon]